MENHNFLMGKSTISMAIFNSKLLVITRGKQLDSREPFNAIYQRAGFQYWKLFVSELIRPCHDVGILEPRCGQRNFSLGQNIFVPSGND
jgi:hypothetical protein